jgi:hypothetical protein
MEIVRRYPATICLITVVLPMKLVWKDKADGCDAVMFGPSSLDIGLLDHQTQLLTAEKTLPIRFK